MKSIKKQVLLFGAADFAGSCWHATQAINRIGRLEAHHMILYEQSFRFPAEMVVPILYKDSDYIMSLQNTDGWKKARDLIETADLIHCWNNEAHDFAQWTHGLFDIPIEKVRSYTFTGTGYRNEHTEVNARIKKLSDHRVVSQDPVFLQWSNEIHLTFIPHAVDTKSLVPLPMEMRKMCTLACYNKKDGAYQNELHFLRQLFKEFGDWKIELCESTPLWVDRMGNLGKYSMFFQNMGGNGCGTFGRSALEACALGLPTFSYISETASKSGPRGGFDDPAIINVTPQTFRKVFKDTIEKDFETLSTRARAWVDKYYSYETVGALYTQFFEELL